ncbi:MAG: energy transducer TonB [bacterium]
MFGQLFESRARPTRRTGGAALSVAMHTAIIGAATALSTRGAPAPHVIVERVPVTFVAPVTPVVVHTPVLVNTHGLELPSRQIIIAPTVTPISLPPIEPSVGLSFDSLVTIRTSGSPSRGTGIGRALDIGGSDVPSGGAWTGTELLMRITTSAKPRYPESLRQAAIDGRVVVRFTVDTAGRIDMSSVEVLSSTHDLFSRSVRDALPQFRFKPSELAGRRVRSLAEMPFEFKVSR